MANPVLSAVPRNMLFRYSIPCLRLSQSITTATKLDTKYRLPTFGQLEEQSVFADFRAAWNSAGLYFHLTVTQKKQSLWCRPTQLLESDSLQLWIDTRDTHNVHRATKFCHWLIVLPVGGGARHDKPVATNLKINRAKEDSPAINRAKISATSLSRNGGYSLSVHVPRASLNGWNTEDHRNLGFNYAVVDRELGWQTLAIGPEMPIAEDPSLWQTLSLTD